MSIGKIDSPLEKPDDEKLGVGAHIEALTEFIRQCDTPMTIAIQGDWGTGKTSMMQLVEKKLIEDKDKGNYGTIRFNTWQFSQFDLQDDVPVVLLMELLKAFGYQESKAKKFLFGGLKKAGGVLGAIMGGAEGREAMKQLLEADPTNIITQIKELKEDLKKSVKEKLVKDKVDRLVIFIDDLDRMNPGKAVELLEIIKNFLDIKGCVFILAVDYGVVSRGVREKYGEDMDELKGRSFFDKIIQLPFNLPVAQYEIETYLKELFELQDEEARIYKKLAQASVGTNPRALKRMANTLKLIELVAIKKNQFDKDNESDFRRALFASLCLQMAFESVYSQILGSGEYMDFLQDLEDNESAVIEKFKEAIQKLPGNKPEVAEKRLKTFFKALNDSIPMIGDEKNYDLYDAVMRLSGVTASGAQSAEEKENQKHSFDPKLMSQLKVLCRDIENKYSSFWTMIDQKPADGGDEGNEIWIPSTWGDWFLVYIFNLNKDGVDRYFHTNATGEEKREYRDFLIEELSSHLAGLTKVKGNSKNFIKLSKINWKSDSSIKNREATMDRYEQVKQALEYDCSAILGVMEKSLKPSSMAVDQVQNFLYKINDCIKNIFSSDEWEIEILNKGQILYEDWAILTVRKSKWPEDVYIYLSALDGLGQNMALSLYYTEVSPRKKDLKIILDTFKKERESLNLEDVSQDEEKAVINLLPEEMSNWLEGTIFDGDLKFILDDEQQNQIISIMQKCSKVFLSLEETLDAIAES